MDSREIEIHLLDKDLPIKIAVNYGWTAEYVTRLVAGKFLGIKAIALEQVKLKKEAMTKKKLPNIALNFVLDSNSLWRVNFLISINLHSITIIVK